MSRHKVAFFLPQPLPSLPIDPQPTPSPLQQVIQSTIQTSDYDLVSISLTNAKWQARWERLCLHPVYDDAESITPQRLEQRAEARRAVEKEADVWRRDGGLKREEVNVSRLEESQGLVALASEWLEMDSPDEGIRFDSELALRAEFAHALYLSLPVLILPAPSLANRAYLASYARAISSLLQMGGSSASTQITIRIPISDPLELMHQTPAPGALAAPGSPSPMPSVPSYVPAQTEQKHKRLSSLSTRPQSMQNQMSLFAQPNSSTNATGGGGNNRIVSGTSSMMSTPGGGIGTAQNGDPSSTWEMWDCIRTLCNYHPRLSVALDLTNPLPPSVGALARWTAEPVKYIWLPATSFIPNTKGYPVLSKACQAFIRGMAKQSPTYILSQTTEKKHPAGGHNAYLQYVRHITSTSGPGSTPQNTPGGHPAAAMALPAAASDKYKTYCDYLQDPLQPLMDDLGSLTYDAFEKDPVKYQQYEAAITQALIELSANKKHVITVVGAGRGPLVDCALRALLHAGRQANIYAIEKNTAAFVTLQERKELEWRDKVNIIPGDMRTVDVPEKCDILVSELLGSFGDNELSPECLDGAMRLIKPTGVSIPTSYTAHIAPLSTSKLYQETHNCIRGASAQETPFVVMMSQVNMISGDHYLPGVSARCGERIQQCWQFVHPRHDITVDDKGLPLTNSHNTRASTHTFHIPHAATLHGLGGYFEAHLYGDVGLSIHPDNAHAVSPDLFSWFPLFFPLKEPLYLPSGCELQVNLWRMCDGKGKKVWYEWSAESYLPVVQAVANGNTVVTGKRSASTVSTPGIQGIGASVSSTGGLGGVNGSQSSPVMDAQFSPGIGGGYGLQTGELGRVKIGQSTLHNPGGLHYWIGL
ncbi:hypothetical protein L204_105511 [Cryptococcus depauperatus]|nr:protein arginine N-methyltransferase 5 [Cryptococcus depauperatus CBS 7855]